MYQFANNSGEDVWRFANYHTLAESVLEVEMIPKYQDIVDLIKKAATLPAQEEIVELRNAAIKLQDENQQLQVENQEPRKQLSVKSKVKYVKPFYWLTEEGENNGGPFCQLCYDKDQKLIRLQEQNQGVWHCHSCDQTFPDSKYRSKAPEHRGGGFMTS